MGCNAWNHPPGCNCGWGGHYYGTGLPPLPPFTQSTIQAAARAKLESLNIRSTASCYVVPNAICPLCGQQVYFYANEHGSRVYFDDLGPPWPKHGCMDNRDFPLSIAPPVSPPTLRSKSDIKDILEAAAHSSQNFGSRSRKNEKIWALYLVLEVRRDSVKTTVIAESISDNRHTKTEFWFLAFRAVIEPGYFLSRRGDIYSFICIDSMKEVQIRKGQFIEGGESDVVNAIDALRIPESLNEISSLDYVHFHSRRIAADIFFREYDSILSRFAERRIIGPKLVAHYLNESGQKTANGSDWTPRLAYFLICLVDAPLERSELDKRGADPSRIRQEPKFVESKDEAKTHRRSQGYSSRIDDLVKKLSRLGRVTHQGEK